MSKLFEWINSEEGSWTDRPTCIINCMDKNMRNNEYVISISRVNPIDYKYLKKNILASIDEIRNVRIKHYRDKKYIGGTDRICTIEYMKWIKDNKELAFLNKDVETPEGEYEESDIEDARFLSKMVWYFCKERKHQEPLIYPLNDIIGFSGPMVD